MSKLISPKARADSLNRQDNVKPVSERGPNGSTLHQEHRGRTLRSGHFAFKGLLSN